MSIVSKGKSKPDGFGIGSKNGNYGKKHVGSQTGNKNSMFNKFGKNNPNFGSKRTEEQKYNIKISKLQKNISVYIDIINKLLTGESVKDIILETGVGSNIIYEIRNGTHVIHQYLKINDL